MNVGAMNNQGYEMSLKWRDTVKDFSYEIGGQVSYSKNKIVEMAEAPYPYYWMNKTGYSYGQYKAYLNDGFYNSTQEAANHPYNVSAGNKAQAGDLRIVDINGDGIINEQDKIPYGYSNIPRFRIQPEPVPGLQGFRGIGTLHGIGTGQLRHGGVYAQSVHCERAGDEIHV